MRGTEDRPDESPFDRLETAAERVMERAEESARRVAYERGNRLGLLWIHAMVGLVAGTQQLFYGSATQIEEYTGPIARLFLGPVAIIGGLLLVLGLTRKPRRSIPLEAVGLAFVALWDFTMTIGLAWARFKQNTFALIPLDQPLPKGYVTAYPIAVYAGMFGLLVVHLYTLRLLKRESARRADEEGDRDASR